MIQRIAFKKMEALARQFPVVCILGPRQCGKTTLAKIYQQKIKNRDTIYLDLESPADLRKLSDPELLFTQNENTTFVLDEVQRLPNLFEILRSVVDRKKKAGRFILLGSASPHLIKGSSETLAGRIAFLQVYPFHYLELDDKANVLKKHLLRGGFPDAYLAKNDTQCFNWMDSFVRTFVERDLNTLFGSSFSPQLMFKLWRMLAHHHGGIWNAQSFSRGLDVSPATVNRYLEYLEGAFMIRKLAPYYTNIGKRLVKSPKVYISDTGLLHYLSDIYSYKTLQTHPIVGYSWEGYAVEQICQLLPRNIQPYYYRTHDGSEIDLVLVKGIAPICCIEIKWSLSPALSRGLTQSITDLKSKKNYIIIPEQDAEVPLRKDINSVGLGYFLRYVLPKITR